MNNSWPFKKITGINGELFHINNKPFMVRIAPDIEVVLDDIVEFIEEDKHGEVLKQLGKVMNIFFLESTQAIIAQIEREPDKKMIALEISKIRKNINQAKNFPNSELKV